MTPDQGDTPRTPPEQQPQHQPPGQQGPPGQQPFQGSQQPQQGQPRQGQQQGQPQQGPPQSGQRRQSPPRQQGPQTPQRGMGQSQHQSQPGQQRQQSGAGQFQGQQSPTGQSQRGQPQQLGQTPSAMQSQQAPAQQRGPQSVQQSQRGQGMQGGQTMGMQSGTTEPRFLEPVRVDDVVQTDVYTAERDTQLSTIVDDMDELQVGSVVVVDDGTPIGIITDREIALELNETPDLIDKTAEELIGKEVVSATKGTDLFEVLDTMNDEEIRRIPVVDEEGQLEGIIALDDILILLETKLETVTDTIESQFPQL